MTTEKKNKNCKELENQIRDVRQQLTDQLRCLDQRTDCHLGLVWELQEYYRRHAEVESELSRGLDKLGKQISARHKAEKQRREMWVHYSTNDTWKTLLAATKQRSQDYATLADIYGTVMVGRLGELLEDLQRVHKKCRDVLSAYQEELVKVLNELLNAMKTYHAYHGDSQQAENKLLRVQSQRVKAEQPKTIGRRFAKDYEKESEKKQAKYNENKLKALKARNEYLLAIDNANAAVVKYFKDDLPLLIEKMDVGYHALLGQITSIHVRTEECLVHHQRQRLESMQAFVWSVSNPTDRDSFRTLYAKVFAIPESFEFQPHAGDDICQLSAQKAVQGEMIERLKALKERLVAETAECKTLFKAVADADKLLMDKIKQSDDLDIAALFQEDCDKPPLKSPVDRDKRKLDRIETEDAYLGHVSKYLRAGNLVARLQAKSDSLQKALGEDISELSSATHNASDAPKRPPSLPPKPRRMKSMFVDPPKLFGGSIDEFVKKTLQPIPQIVLSCIKQINLYGMHHQGIFRISGSQADMNSFKAQFEQGEDPLDGKLDEDDINSVAGLLKLYFRELKEPLFPTAMFDQWIECSTKYNINNPAHEAEWKSTVRNLLASLPQSVIGVMRYLFAFLNHVTEYSDENMMDASNLAICFGPTLMPIPIGRDQVQYQVYVNEFIKNVIIHFDTIFPQDVGLIYEKCVVSEDVRDKEDVDEETAIGATIMEEDNDQASPTQSDNEQEFGKLEAVALYDFNGRTKRELSFKKGDSIILTQRKSVDWWDGVLNGQSGLVPDKYIKQLPSAKRENSNSKAGGKMKAGPLGKVEESVRKSTECLAASDRTTSDSSLNRATSHPNIAAVGAPNQLPTASKVIEKPSRVKLSQQNSEALGKSEAADKTGAGRVEEDLNAIDSTLAKVLSGLKTLDQMQPASSSSGPSAKTSSDVPAADKVERRGDVVPIVVKTASFNENRDNSSSFPSFSLGKSKAATLPAKTANADVSGASGGLSSDDLKTFGSKELPASQKPSDVKSRSLTRAEGSAFNAAVGGDPSSAAASQTDLPKGSDGSLTLNLKAGGSLPRPNSDSASSKAIPASVPTVPVPAKQLPSPSITGSAAIGVPLMGPTVPPKPVFKKFAQAQASAKAAMGPEVPAASDTGTAPSASSVSKK